MVMLDDDDCLNHGEWEHNKKIADYLNQHPMFKDAERGDICEEGFYFYIVDKLEHIADDPDRLEKIDRAIWLTGDYTDVTMDDCDWFFDQVEERTASVILVFEVVTGDVETVFVDSDRVRRSVHFGADIIFQSGKSLD